MMQINMIKLKFAEGRVRLPGAAHVPLESVPERVFESRRAAAVFSAACWASTCFDAVGISKMQLRQQLADPLVAKLG